jgi:methionine-rich copper-binding protein CopC
VLSEWAYGAIDRTSTERTAARPGWLIRDAARLVIPLRARGRTGEFRVEWEVRSADGHALLRAAAGLHAAARAI